MSFITHQDFPGVSDGKESAYNARDPTSIPGLGRSPGEGNGNPLHSWSGIGTETHSILPCRIPRTEGQPGGPLYVGSERVGHDWVTHTLLVHTRRSQTYLLKMAESLTQGKVKIFSMHHELQFIGLCFLRTERVSKLVLAGLMGGGQILCQNHARDNKHLPKIPMS